MSEPNRYDHISDGYSSRFINGGTGKKSPYGTYVIYEDYAQLKAEVERLRKAGDAMLGDYLETDVIFPPSQDAWNAAKDGKPSV